MSNTATQQPARRRLAGGSQASALAETGNSSSSVISLVRPGVELLIPTEKKVGLTIRFKPAHNPAVDPADPNFALSWVPYRTMDGTLDEKTGLPQFSSWYTAARVYRYFGNGGYTIVSPGSRPREGYTDMDRADPIDHMIRFCKNHDEYKYLIEKPEKSDDPKNKYAKALLSWAETVYMYNVLFVHADQKEAMDAITFMTQGGHNYLCEQLDAMRPHNMPENMVDARWPNFLLGDVTDPNRGWAAAFRKHQVGNSNASPWCPLWSQRVGHLDKHGLQPWAMNEQQMRNRWDLLSEDTVWIESYQRIVEIVLNDGLIPREVVAQACGHLCDIPGSGQQQPTFKSSVTEYNPSQDHIPGLPGPATPTQHFAPAVQPQTFAPAQPQSFAPQDLGIHRTEAPAIGGMPVGPGYAGQVSQVAPPQPFSAPPAPFSTGAAPFGQSPAAFPSAPVAPGGFQSAPVPAPGVFAPPVSSPPPAFQMSGGFAAPNPLSGSMQGAPDVPFDAAPPPPFSAPPAPAPVAVQPVVDPTLYWVSTGGAVLPAKHTLEQAFALNAPDCKVMDTKDPSRTWKDLATVAGTAPIAVQSASAQPGDGPLTTQERARLEMLIAEAADPQRGPTMEMTALRELGDLNVRKLRHG